MRSVGTSSARDTRAQISFERTAVSSAVILPMFLTATNAVGAPSPPNVIGSPGTRQVITHFSGLPKRAAASFDSSPSRPFAPSGGASEDVNTWMSGISSDRLHVRDQIGDLAVREPGRAAVLGAAAGGVEAPGQRPRAAVVHEGRAGADADQRRGLERGPRPAVDARVVREQRARVARGAGGAARGIAEQLTAAFDGRRVGGRGARDARLVVDPGEQHVDLIAPE